MLEEQCNTWGGITSVAVYLPLVYFQAANDKKLQEAISHVEDFHEQIDRTHGWYLTHNFSLPLSALSLRQPRLHNAGIGPCTPGWTCPLLGRCKSTCASHSTQ